MPRMKCHLPRKSNAKRENIVDDGELPQSGKTYKALNEEGFILAHSFSRLRFTFQSASGRNY